MQLGARHGEEIEAIEIIEINLVHTNRHASRMNPIPSSTAPIIAPVTHCSKRAEKSLLFAPHMEGFTSVTLSNTAPACDNHG